LVVAGAVVVVRRTVVRRTVQTANKLVLGLAEQEELIGFDFGSIGSVVAALLGEMKGMLSSQQRCGLKM
jgi:hypothetical protein